MSAARVHVRDCARTPMFQALQDALDPRRTLERAVAIQQVPAPTFEEEKRARVVHDYFCSLGLLDVQRDAYHNVIGRWPGIEPDRPAILLTAHLDTVFPADTDLAVREFAGRIRGAGLGDNSLGVAALISLADALTSQQVHLPADLWFAATSREEGLGNLDGIRAVWAALGQRLGAAIVVEGMALGRIYHAGIAVRRLKIVCRAPGGHSWLHFGQPSAVHGLITAGHEILQLIPPSEPRTTYNIGLISGGRSVNSLATEAELWLDLRSEDPAALRALEQQVRACVGRVQRPPDLEFEISVVGDRPAGAIAQEHALVQLAIACLETVGVAPTLERGSTDANLLLAAGLPAITIGISQGGNAHRPDEFIETAPVHSGLRQLALLTLAAATWDFAAG